MASISWIIVPDLCISFCPRFLLFLILVTASLRVDYCALVFIAYLVCFFIIPRPSLQALFHQSLTKEMPISLVCLEHDSLETFSQLRILPFRWLQLVARWHKTGHHRQQALCWLNQFPGLRRASLMVLETVESRQDDRIKPLFLPHTHSLFFWYPNNFCNHLGFSISEPVPKRRHRDLFIYELMPMP